MVFWTFLYDFWKIGQQIPLHKEMVFLLLPGSCIKLPTAQLLPVFLINHCSVFAENFLSIVRIRIACILKFFFQSALKKIHRFITSSVFEVKVSGKLAANFCRAAVRVCVSIVCTILMLYLKLMNF